MKRCANSSCLTWIRQDRDPPCCTHCRRNLGRTWSLARMLAALLLFVLVPLAACGRSEPECTTAELESCQLQRQVAVDRAEELLGELADEVVRRRQAEAEAERLAGLLNAARPACLRREEFAMPPEAFCWIRVDP